MENTTYRNWLQARADAGNPEAMALLHVVGDDGSLDQGFVNQELVDGRYNWQAPEGVPYDAEYGQVQGGDKWYGPEGAARLNNEFATDYKLALSGETGGYPVTDDSGGYSSGGDTDPVLNQAAVDNTMKAISSLDTELGIGRDNIQSAYDDLIGGYDRERERTREDYDEGVVTNTKNLQSNKQNALVSAAQGLRGLRGVLSSIGALSGDGRTLANRAVTTEANRDIGGAADTFAGNAKNLDRAWERFDEEDDERRQDAEDARVNQRRSLKGSILGKKQDYFQKLAELYGEADNTTAAEKYLNKAGDLNTPIAEMTAVKASPFTRRGAAFTPGDLESYLAGAGDMTVQVAGGGVGGQGGPTTVLAGRQGRKRDEEERRQTAMA